MTSRVFTSLLQDEPGRQAVEGLCYLGCAGAIMLFPGMTALTLGCLGISKLIAAYLNS